MEIHSPEFKEKSRIALHDVNLQKALSNLKAGFPVKRSTAVARMPEFEQLRDEATALKNHILENLDIYLEQFEANVIKNGGHVHWCRTPDDACKKILEICKDVDAKTVTKGKSMVSEEINLNDYLQKNGVEPIETDLGEYILQ